MTVLTRNHMLPVTGGDTLHVLELWPDEVPGAQTVVFCHGAGGCHVNWYHQAAHFSTTHRVILWDHRGFGRSTNGAGLASPTTAAADLRAVVATAGGEAAHVVAQSMGGWAALTFAAEYPTQVRSLTLSGTCAGLLSEATVLRLKQFVEESQIHAGFLFGSRAVAAGYGEKQPSSASLYNLLTRAIPSTYPDAVTDLVSHPFHGDLSQLAGIPVLAVVGEHDQVFPPDEVRRAFSGFPDIEFAVVAGSGHSPYVESPAEFNRLLGAVLRRRTARGT